MWLWPHAHTRALAHANTQAEELKKLMDEKIASAKQAQAQAQEQGEEGGGEVHGLGEEPAKLVLE